MSDTYTIEIQCDRCYEHFYPRATGDAKQCTAEMRKIREYAVGEGWQTIPAKTGDIRRDYCPRCK